MAKHKFRHLTEHLADHEEKFRWSRIIARNAPDTTTAPTIMAHQPIYPEINRYFHIVESDLQLTNGATLSAKQFTDDNGVQINDFSIVYPNGYVNLFINAVMQEGGIYAVTPSSLLLNANHATIFRGTPIIIESIGFFTTRM
ncbi:DUF4183 domain-containing protein [Lysinibacillus sp. NPDC097195]|uniref:DUF4183 domain-containing protein n=1 Tax=Lysinibacillus sp. NPDC097195 TaxID=3364141 RepID=UPI00381A4B8E